MNRQIDTQLLGIWLLSQYLSTGVKHDIQLVEFGPGKGTLMDVHSPGVLAAISAQMSR
jgi:SAM-dependent MidA family methyltransferase